VRKGVCGGLECLGERTARASERPDQDQGLSEEILAGAGCAGGARLFGILGHLVA
jgi:hypothetical protein